MYFLENWPVVCAAQFILIVLTVVFNAWVIVCMLNNSASRTIFDSIMLGHAIVDFLTGLFDIPLYHIYYTFGYWPLGSLLGMHKPF